MDVCDRFIGSSHSALATFWTWVWFETLTVAGNVNVILFGGRPSVRMIVNLLKPGIDRQRSGRVAEELLANGLIEHDASRSPVSGIGKSLRSTPNTSSIRLPTEMSIGLSQITIALLCSPTSPPDLISLSVVGSGSTIGQTGVRMTDGVMSQSLYSLTA